MDPLERLTNLVALLLATRQPLTFEQIADALAGQYPSGASARRGAFERDKRMLREAGVPLEQEVLTGAHAGATGYRIDRRRYELDLDLTPEERRALQVAVAAVHLGVDWAEDALLKVGLDDGADDLGPVAAVPAQPALPALFEANATRATVRFGYRGSPRMLDPWAIGTRDGFWYVTGRDHRSGERRTFRVDRMEGDVVVGPPASFEPPADFDPRQALPQDPKTIGGAEPAGALVAVDAVRAGKVRREAGEDAVVEQRADGSIVVRVPSTNEEAFRSWVLGLGEHAEGLAPPQARAAMAAWLGAIAGARP